MSRLSLLKNESTSILVFNKFTIRQLSSENSSDSQTPVYVDVTIIIGLGIAFSAILFYLIRRARKWRENEDKRKKRLKSKEDAFYLKYGYTWDLVLVFNHEVEEVEYDDVPIKKVEDLVQKEHLKEKKRIDLIGRIVIKLKKSGFEVFLFYSIQRNHVFCKLRIPLERLLQEADRIDYKLQLDPLKLEAALKQGNLPKWKPIVFTSLTNKLTRMNPFLYIYGKYHPAAIAAPTTTITTTSLSSPSNLYREYNEKTHAFLRDVDRLNLIQSIISASESSGHGCNLNIPKLIKDKVLHDYFPLHDYDALDTLTAKWLVFVQSPFRDTEVIDSVRLYFGEKIAIYCLWLQHCSRWLIAAAVAGLAAWVNVADEGNNPNAPDIPYFSAFIAIWTTLLLEFWKRRESEAAMKYGMTDYEANETERYDFEGIEIDSPINCEKVKYFSFHDWLLRHFATKVLNIGLITVVVIVMLGLFLLKIILRPYTIAGFELGGVVVPFIQTAVMIIFDYFYTSIALNMNEYENHRTDTEYEDSLILKTFAFKFVNNYAALFYIAFGKINFQDFDQCTANDCMKELQISLGTILISKLLFNIANSVVLPMVQNRWNKKSHMKEISTEGIKKMTAIERICIKGDYDKDGGGTIEDYSSNIIFLGYTTMFISAFPLATVLTFLNCYFQSRLIAWRLCYIYRRPMPKGCQDIGTWYIILEGMTAAAVLVNAGLIAFTRTDSNHYPGYTKVWIFVGISALILIGKYTIATIIPDQSREVSIQLQRQNYFVRKVIENEEDDDAWKTSDVESPSPEHEHTTSTSANTSSPRGGSGGGGSGVKKEYLEVDIQDTDETDHAEV